MEPGGNARGGGGIARPGAQARRALRRLHEPAGRRRAVLAQDRTQPPCGLAGAGEAGSLRSRPRRGAVAEVREGTGFHRSRPDRKSTRLNSSHVKISYAVFCLKKKKKRKIEK